MEFIENLSIAVVLAAVAGLVLLWVRNRLERPIARARVLIPRTFTPYQRSCIRDAKYYWKRIQDGLKGGLPQSRIMEEVEDCLWAIVGSHFRSVDDLYVGTTRNLSLRDVYERGIRLKSVVLLPMLLEIATCRIPERKAFLTCKFVFVLEAGVFDPIGSWINYNVLMEVTGADYHSPSLLSQNRGSFLGRLGFSFRSFDDDGSLRTVWYWPNKITA